MTTFDKREEGFEKKFALDEELLFKAGARRNWRKPWTAGIGRCADITGCPRRAEAR